jgi:hypothetical protein
MPNPQQPELRRSEYTDADQDAWDLKAEEPRSGKGTGGPQPVPEDNQPGHHPDHEQDKPVDLGGAGHGS